MNRIWTRYHARNKKKVSFTKDISEQMGFQIPTTTTSLRRSLSESPLIHWLMNVLRNLHPFIGCSANVNDSLGDQKENSTKEWEGKNILLELARSLLDYHQLTLLPSSTAPAKLDWWCFVELPNTHVLERECVLFVLYPPCHWVLLDISNT